VKTVNFLKHLLQNWTFWSGSIHGSFGCKPLGTMPSLNIRFCFDAGEMALTAECGELVFALLPGRSGFPGLYAFENCSSPS
jgi:hypothetical protein